MAEEYHEEEIDSSEENVYKESSREKLLEDGEISPEEEGFMAGYEEDHEESEESEEEDIDKGSEEE